MALGQVRRFLLLSLAPFLLSASAEKKPAPEQLEKLASLVSMGSWEDVLKDSQEFQSDALIQILRQKARFELKEWEQILSAPANQDFRFKDYDDYIRNLALYESKQYEKLVEASIPAEIPPVYQEYLRLIRARSYLALKNFMEAKNAFRKFLDDFPASTNKSEVMLELANVEWELDNKYEALHLYEKIYIYHPIRDSDDRASQRLKEMGRFKNIEPDVHLKRIHYLQQAALFAKAIKELQHLERISTGKDRERIRLSLASLEFARKNYSKAEQLSLAGLKRNTKADIDQLKDWKSLLAFSLVRQGKYEKARNYYDELLALDIPAFEKEQILLRLGLMAVDDKDFESAESYFERLRKEFPKGRYQESSHWFQAWAIIQQSFTADESGQKKLEPKLKTAIELLNKIPKLPQGQALTGQSLYWQAQLEKRLNRTTKSKQSMKSLQKKWGGSFYSLLDDPKKFEFLDFNESYAAPELIIREDRKFLVADPAFQQLSWKRLEAFVSVHLFHWAQLELETFMKVSAKKNEGLRAAVAHRLEVLEDWSDLIKFAQRHFPLRLDEIKHDEPLSRFHYPQAYGEEVLKAANEFQVSPFLIWGVMREESRFQADALSSAGAVGLLQLMPNLGNQIAARLKEKRVSRHQLTNPQLNIRYATYHLRELIDQIKSWKTKPEFVFPLVVASYNAGIGPARRWLNERPETDLDVFVESIPYSETRNYVKRVIQSANIYWQLYGEKNDRIAKTKGGSDL